ncbi:MarR family winged helix-turn-helix transcriptional regulator [Bradyrhizobium sp. S3.2.12]|uniref:MarR family winged helix-turn-helix transcriptional regulator n=1 Tax=Bradyrhizobium sp. S3.2.12 TaxID=3156387 RepID=UPI003393B73D
MTADPAQPSISDEEIESLEALFDALKPFFEMEHAVLPAAYIRAFILVGKKEGLSVSEYAQQLQISPTVMTRNLLDIGDRNRQREKGFQLITQERDPYDLRKHRARLTPRGRKLAHDINVTLRRLRKK